MINAVKQMEVTKVKVGEMTFFIKKFPAFKAAKLSGELSSFVGPLVGALGGILSLTSKGQDGKKIDPSESFVFDLENVEAEDFASVLSNALSGIAGERLEYMMKELLITYKNVSYLDPDTGDASIMTQMDAEEIFCGNVQDMFLLCYEVIKANYSGFFGKLLPRFGFRFKTTEQKETEDTENTDSSTQAVSVNSN